MKSLLIALVFASLAIGAETRPGRRDFERVRDGASFRWSIEVKVDRDGWDVNVFTANVWRAGAKDFGRYVSHYINNKDQKAFESMLAKFLVWAESARRDRAPDFVKDLPTIGRTQWQMQWSKQKASLVTQIRGESLTEEDAEVFRVLSLDLPELVAEYNAAVRAADDYASKLK